MFKFENSLISNLLNSKSVQYSKIGANSKPVQFKICLNSKLFHLKSIPIRNCSNLKPVQIQKFV
jgi:hypothetical protein